MRSYCKLSNAELAAGDLVHARQFAESALPFFAEFKLDSPSLLVLRDMGLCYEALGNVQRRTAMDHSLSGAVRRTAQAEARQWYGKSAAVWREWNARGAATPESEIDRRRIDRLLGGSGATSGNLTVFHVRSGSDATLEPSK
jgi:hypothetical protein